MPRGWSSLPNPSHCGRQCAECGEWDVSVPRDDSVVCWGWNDSGQCTVPNSMGEVVATSAGFEHTVAIPTDGTVRCWGFNDFGQCVVPKGLARATEVSAGGMHTVVSLRSR